MPPHFHCLSRYGDVRPSVTLMGSRKVIWSGSKLWWSDSKWCKTSRLARKGSLVLGQSAQGQMKCDGNSLDFLFLY